MKRHLILPGLLAAILLPASAGEHEIQPHSFEKVLRLEATLFPARPVSLAIAPEKWSTFTIREVVPHGAMVRKGQSIAEIESEDLDRKIRDEERAARLRKIDLAAARRELADLEILTPRKLEVAERKNRRAQEDLAYFRKVSRSEKEKAARRSVERAERQLEYQEEELTQLLAMYQEDDLTEETEEIILKRQRNMVMDAENFLERARINRDKVLKTDVPREAQDLKQKAEEADLGWQTARETLPRALEKKRLEVAKLEEADQRADEALADLRADRKLMGLKSPAKGQLYYGEIAEGTWDVGQTAKFMKPGGNLPAKTVFATVIPEGGPRALFATVGEGQLPGLRKGLEGTFAPKMAPRQRLSVRVTEVSRHPDLSGRYQVRLALLEKGPGLVAGMSGKVALVTYEAEDALTIPASALRERSNGEIYVEVKTGGDEVEEREVRLGPESDGRIVVEKGLAAGEVVITEEEEGE